jgi:hypothetical protein
MADSCASLARACSSAEISVRVNTTPSGVSARSTVGDRINESPLFFKRARYGRMRRK